MEALLYVLREAGFEVSGAALMQMTDEGLRPIAFYSRKLIKAEINYTTREQELLAIRAALKVWRHYLAGMPLEIHTDHKSLKYIQTQPQGQS